MPLPPFALAAPVLIATGDILPLVVAGVSGGDALVCGTTLVLIVALKIRCDSALQFFVDAGLEAFKFCGFGVSELGFGEHSVSPFRECVLCSLVLQKQCTVHRSIYR